MILKIKNEIITDRCSYITEQEVIQIVDKTLDGNRHLQVMGSPSIDYKVTCVTDKEGVEKIREANALGFEVFITEKNGKIIFGHMIDLPTVSSFGYSAKKVELTLARLEETL